MHNTKNQVCLGSSSKQNLESFAQITAIRILQFSSPYLYIHSHKFSTEQQMPSTKALNKRELKHSSRIYFILVGKNLD